MYPLDNKLFDCTLFEWEAPILGHGIFPTDIAAVGTILTALVMTQFQAEI